MERGSLPVKFKEKSVVEINFDANLHYPEENNVSKFRFFSSSVIDNNIFFSTLLFPSIQSRLLVIMVNQLFQKLILPRKLNLCGVQQT